MKGAPRYACQQCGAAYPKWTGRCEACGAWKSLAYDATRTAPPIRQRGV
jgi:DNA repair protein RadA/Sms